MVRWVVRPIWAVVWRTMVRRAMMRRAMVRVIQSLIKRLQFRLKPGLSIKGSVLDLVADIINLIEGCIKSSPGLLGGLVPSIL